MSSFWRAFSLFIGMAVVVVASLGLGSWLADNSNTRTEQSAPAPVITTQPTIGISFETCTAQALGITATRYDHICMVSVDRITYASVTIDADWCNSVNLTSPLGGDRQWVIETKGDIRLSLVSQKELASQSLMFYNPSPSITLNGNVLTDMGRIEHRSCTAGAPESTN